ncbi:helix-turn-helix domain-containing protein [Paenibacillus cremeus]|nr:helix-turn-helix transcriptional regulator [Paenibacillus cremeus]
MIRIGENLLFSVADLQGLEISNCKLYMLLPATFENDLLKMAEMFKVIILEVENLSGSNHDRPESQLFIGMDTLDNDDVNYSTEEGMFSFGSYPEVRKKIGSNLRAALKKKGLTQAKAAKALGISAAAMSNLVKGDTSLKTETVAMIKSRLDIDRDVLFRGVRWDDNAYENNNGTATEVEVDSDMESLISVVSNIDQKHDRNVLKNVLKNLIKTADLIGIDNTNSILNEIFALIKRGNDHNRDADQLFDTNYWFIEEYTHLLSQISKSITSYPPGVQTTMSTISQYIDFIIAQNKKQRELG